MKRFKLTPLNLLVHALAWVPLVVLIWDYANGHLTVNPIQAAEQRTGKIALVLLMLSLSVTPLQTLTGWRQVHSLRRPLGIYAFLYALLHFTIFSVVDYGLDWAFLKEAVLEKPFALVGLAALVLLLPLATTSWRWWMRKLGKTWTQLHRLVYLAGMLVVIHFGWAMKGDFFRAAGNVLQPILFGLLLVLLLVLRLPPVRRAVVNWRMAAVNRVRQHPSGAKERRSHEKKMEV